MNDVRSAAADAQRITDRNARIVECQEQIKRLTDELVKLQAESRRERLLASFEFKPDQTWNELTEEERRDKDMVLKAAASGALGTTGQGSFQNRLNRLYTPPPQEMLADRDVVLALVARKDFSREIFNDTFEVPTNVRNEKEVMMAVCAKNSKAFRLASPELRDDPELVITTLKAKEYYSMYQFEFASDRLRGDKAFILDMLAEAGPSKDEFDRSDAYGFLNFINVNFQEEKEIALALLSKCIRFNESVSGNLHDYFSSELKDDKGVMLKFIEADPWTLACCSDRLKGCKDVVQAAVTKNKNAIIHASKTIQDEAHRGRFKDKKSVIASIEKEGLEFEAIPDKMKEDKDILETAIIQHGIDIFRDLPPRVRQSKRLIYAAASSCEPPRDFFDLIPPFWQKDEELAMKLIEADYFDWPEKLLEIQPSLHQSKKSMMAIAGLRLEGLCGRLTEIMVNSPFTDDKEVMMRACQSDTDCIECVSSRLLSDRDFVSDFISKTEDSVILVELSDDFKRNNVDLVVRAIEVHYTYSRPDEMIMGDDGEGTLLSCVWDQKDVVTSCLKKGFNVLEALHYDVPGSPFLDDEEIVTLAVKSKPNEFQYASTRLKSDRDFVLSLLRINIPILDCAERSLIQDDELLLAAISNDAGAIVQCFPRQTDENFAYLVGFALRIRSRLAVFDSFVDTFLAGVSIHRPHVAPALRCHLPLLDRGTETSSGFIRLIAEFAAIPMFGEVRRLRLASSRLRVFGY